MKSTAYTVNATATLIVPAQHYFRQVAIHSSTGSIYLGASNVTGALDGVHVKNGDTLVIDVPINETIYAVDGFGTAKAIVLDSSAD